MTFSNSQQVAFDAAQQLGGTLTSEEIADIRTTTFEIIAQIKEGLLWYPARTISHYLSLIGEACVGDTEIEDMLEDFYQTRADGKESGEDKRVIKWAIKHLPELAETLISNNHLLFGMVIIKSLIGYQYLYEPEHKDVVYFIRNPTGLVKIGFTSNLPSRLKTLINSSGSELEVIHTFTPVKKKVANVETYLHRHYAVNRVMGEWFDIEYKPEDWEALCKKCDG